MVTGLGFLSRVFCHTKASSLRLTDFSFFSRRVALDETSFGLQFQAVIQAIVQTHVLSRNVGQYE